MDSIPEFKTGGFKTVRQVISTFDPPQREEKQLEEKVHNVISSQEYLNKKEELEVHRQDAIAYLRDKINSTIAELAKFGVRGEFHEAINLNELNVIPEFSMEEVAIHSDEAPVVVDTSAPVGDFECTRCHRVFATEWGLKVHHARTRSGSSKCVRRKANGRA